MLLHDGRFDISNMMPGDVKRVAFTFDVEPALSDPEAKVQLQIRDEDLREEVDEKVRLPIQDALTVVASGGTQRAKAQGADLRASPDSGSRVFGRLPSGAAATVAGLANGYVKLVIGPEGRFGSPPARRTSSRRDAVASRRSPSRTR